MDNSSDLFPEEDKNSFEAAFAWWEKRRLRYNMIVGVAGIFVVVLHGLKDFDAGTIIFIGIIGISANGLYCLGYLLEFFLKYYFRLAADFADKRNTVFWAGTIFSILILIAFAAFAEFTK